MYTINFLFFTLDVSKSLIFTTLLNIIIKKWFQNNSNYNDMAINMYNT